MAYMMTLCDISGITTLLQEGGVLWAFVGVFVMLIPKILEWFRNSKKDATEGDLEKERVQITKRQTLITQLSALEEIITNQQSRYMVLHEQLISEREASQGEKLALQNRIFDLERRVKVLEDKTKADEALLITLQQEIDEAISDEESKD